MGSAPPSRRLLVEELASRVGLRPVLDAAGAVRGDAFILPDSRGVAPYGVPHVWFGFRGSPDPGLSHVESNWSLRLSGLSGVSFGECAWDDVDGLAGLVRRLAECGVDDFVVEAALTGGGLLRCGPGKLRRLAGEVEGLLSLPAVDDGGLDSPWLAVSGVDVFDPATCRFVTVPGLRRVDVRRAMVPGSRWVGSSVVRRAGLVSLLPEVRTRGVRYVACAGVLSRGVDPFLSWGLQDAFRERFFSGPYGSLVLHAEAITVEERNALLV